MSAKGKLLSHEVCVAFAVFFEAINMAPFSFEGVDGLFEFTHPKFEAFKQTSNEEREIPSLQLQTQVRLTNYNRI